MNTDRKEYVVIHELISHLERVVESLEEQKLDDIIDGILSAKRIFVYGAGRSGYVARSFAQRLKQIGFEAYFIGDTTTPASEKGDLLVVVSGSGQTPSVLAILRKARALGIKIILVTSHGENFAAKLSDVVMYVPGKTKLLEKPSHAPFTSLFDIATLSVLDGITAELMERRNITDKDIGMTHANLE